MLKRLHLENVGPASRLDVAFADRLNVFTGDNGLGKSFLLDIAWWLLTQGGNAPTPKREGVNSSHIEYITEIYREDTDQFFQDEHQIHFDVREQQWFGTFFSAQPDIVLGIHARADNSFSIFDSLRSRPAARFFQSVVRTVELSPKQLWDGTKEGEVVLCNGLIQDWVRWQNHPDQTTFTLLWQILKTLFPAEESPSPGDTTRISVQDVREIPTIQLVYGNVPIIQLSAGMKRIVSLAYSIAWTWFEHKQAAKLMNFPPASKILLFIDEIEAHLHVQWQRSIFPAILEAIKLLAPDIQVQVLTTTHSPLVLASLEPHFDESQDKLFGFELHDRQVLLKELPWVKLGEVDHWLTSPIFGLSRPRSKEAEMAIDAAYAIMRNADMSGFPEKLRSQEGIHQELRKVLPDDDIFWRRWIVTAERIRVS